MAQTEKVWQFHCPECGLGHVEFACLATDDEIFCVVCQEEHQVQVRLHRWLEAQTKIPQARLRGGLAG